MFIDLLRTRRSIRRFSDRPVEPEKIDLLIEAALRSPSSRGRCPWEIVVVTDTQTIARLAVAKPSGAELLRGAPLVIVVCADPQASDVWVEDATIATTLVHLEAHDLGLGSCWVQVRLRPHDERSTAEQYVALVLDLAPGITVEAMVGIGYPAETKPGHPATTLPTRKVRRVTSGRHSSDHDARRPDAAARPTAEPAARQRDCSGADRVPLQKSIRREDPRRPAGPRRAGGAP